MNTVAVNKEIESPVNMNDLTVKVLSALKCCSELDGAVCRSACPYSKENEGIESTPICMAVLACNAMRVIKFLLRKSTWRQFSFRPPTADEQAWFKGQLVDEPLEIIENCPEDGQEVLLCSGGIVTLDTFRIGECCSFDNAGVVKNDMMWMPKPDPDPDKNAAPACGM